MAETTRIVVMLGVESWVVSLVRERYEVEHFGNVWLGELRNEGIRQPRSWARAASRRSSLHDCAALNDMLGGECSARP